MYDEHIIEKSQQCKLQILVGKIAVANQIYELLIKLTS
jgi:hypothetical protein